MSHSGSARQTGGDLATWRLTVSGLCASLIGIGLARFAYTPLLPAIVGAGWFGGATAAYLGAANLAGYLAGALLAGPLAARLGARGVLRGGMLAASVAFFACGWPVDFAWFFAWRFLSGMAGGAVMVLAAPTVLPHVAPSRRGLVSGTIFMGVGLGVAASGTLVPLLLRQGLQQTWFGLGVLALVLTLVAWGGWPRPAPATAAPGRSVRHRIPRRALWSVTIQYGLNAFGLVPHMIFLVDYVARGLGQGVTVGAEYWVIFGLGAVVGPLVTGHVADRIGFVPTLRLAYLVEAAAVALPLMGYGATGLIVSSFVVGAFTPGIVPLMLGRIHEIMQHHPALQKRAWGMATISFAIMQATGAYGMSFLFVRSGGDYGLLFTLGAGAMLVALMVELSVSAVFGRRSEDNL
ncbi:YbfB/YjiJ family MFS transporter [Acidisphaera sp. L21]|uniref:YbfB/YjiJ family MFS transporter n=1 Tax=Acidisphaera sp. L21 TaxID=1641851 RepID=UPI00131B8F12|nr:YbfB/YjiJ family MFS transporter [Acidisphaera sp. L21]